MYGEYGYMGQTPCPPGHIWFVVPFLGNPYGVLILVISYLRDDKPDIAVLPNTVRHGWKVTYFDYIHVFYYKQLTLIIFTMNLTEHVTRNTMKKTLEDLS